MKTRYRISVLPAVAALLMLLGIAAAPAVLDQPMAPSIRATSNDGELVISWDGISGAQYYTVGWINWTEGQPVLDAGGDWLSLFHYTTVAGHRTSYTVKGLDGGDSHYAIMRATDVEGSAARFGGAYSAWSGWSSSPAQPTGQGRAEPTPSTDCINAGTCIPVVSLGTYTGTGDAASTIVDLHAGFYRITASSTSDRFFDVELIPTKGGYYAATVFGIGPLVDEIETFTIYDDGKSYHDQAGSYLLQIDAVGSWTVSIERIN